MSQGVIIRRSANKVLDKDYLELALASCGKFWSAAFVDKGSLELFKGSNPTADTIIDTLAEFPDIDVTLYLSDEVGGEKNERLPPYPVIHNDDEAPLVAIIPEGNFPGFVKEKSPFSAASFLAEKLYEDFNEAFDLVDKDIGKFMAGIQKDSFQKKVNLNTVSRGYITVIAQNGQSFTFAQGETAKQFDWGWVSNSFDYGAKAEDPPAAKKGGLFSRSTVREKVQHQPSNAVQASGAADPPETETKVIPPDTGTPVPPKKDKEKDIFAISDIRVGKIKIPQSMNRKNKRAWIKERIGYNPQGVDDPKSEYEVYTKPDGTVLTKAEINRLFGLSAAGLVALKNPEPASKAEENNTKDPDYIPMPVLSGASRTRLKEFISSNRVKKIIGENASIITDPYNVQSTEAKLPALAVQLERKDLSEFEALPFAQLLEIGRGNIHELANIAHAFRLDLLNTRLKLNKALGKTAEVSEPQAPKEESPPEVPKKKGLFSRNAA